MKKMQIPNFSGRLYYDGDGLERLDVTDFIVRGAAVSFSLASVSSEHGSWSAAGIATLSVPGAFVADGIIATKRGVNADQAWDFTFKVDQIGQDLLYVEGHVDADGESHPFSGDLERKVIPPVSA